MAGKYANYILFNRAWIDVFNDLTDEQLGAVVRDLYRIADGNESEISNPMLKIIVKICGAEIIQNNEQYKQKCETLKANRSGKTINNKCNQLKSNVLKEEKKEGRIERRTEGLLSNPSGLERDADSPPVGGSPHHEENPKEYMERLMREGRERKLKEKGSG